MKSHVRGNLNVGNDRSRLIEVVTQLLPIIGYPRSLNAINAINEVVPPAPETVDSADTSEEDQA